MGKIKVFVCGALTGSLLLTGATLLVKNNKQTNKDFDKPMYEESFDKTKEVQEYTFDYYGKPITIQGESVQVYSFDENGKMTIKDGTTKIVEKDDSYLLDEYISQKEAYVFKTLDKKDDVKDPFSIYILFDAIEDVYKEYLNRKEFDTLSDRKEVLYKVCYDYVLTDNGYTIGGYLFKDLPLPIQKDIKKCVDNIYYMRQYKKEVEQTPFNEFMDKQAEVVKYELFKIGR